MESVFHQVENLMQQGPAADLDMQNVPLAAVVTEAKHDDEQIPDKELLPNNPNQNMEYLARETGLYDKDDDVEDEPTIEIDNEQSLPSLIIELFLIPTLMILPLLVVSMSAEYNSYKLSLVKGPLGLNSYREFERWGYFLAVSYALFVIMEIVFRALPWFVFLLCRWLGKILSRHERTAVSCLRYAANYLSLAMAIILMLNWSEWILYESSADQAVKQVLSQLSWRQQVAAHELLLGDKFESFLVATFVLVTCLAIEKFLVAAIHASFHRVALAPRISRCNKKFAVLGTLYRARQSTRATLSTATLTSVGVEDEQDLTEDQSVDLSSASRARLVAKCIFKTICPADRPYIISSDFRPYFPLDKYEKAFQIFDGNHKGQLDRHDFKSAVVAIYDERFRTAKALIANGHIVRKLDWVLFIIFLLFGLLFALVVFNHSAYSWVTSLGTFILGFSFLFQTTVTRIFDTFLFVFVEHAYDVSDSVLIDNERLSIKEIEIFTTISLRNDGLQVYSPNSVLKGKTIYNKQRVRSEVDEIVFSIHSATGIEKLTKIRSRLTDYLTETVNEFSGTINVTVLGFKSEETNRLVRVKVEPKYRPREDDLHSELSLHSRRESLLKRFSELCDELELEISIEGASK